MATICVLLPSSIQNDARVIKTIRTLSKHHDVDLFHIDGSSEQYAFFNNRVALFPIAPKADSFRKKVISHSLFYRAHLHLVDAVLSQQKRYDFIFANDLPTLLPASKLARRFKAKLVYDSHEIYCETLNQFFPTNPGAIKRIFYKSLLAFMRFSGTRMERKLLREVDEFITVNESILEYFKGIYSIRSGHSIMNLPLATKNDVETVNFRDQFNWSPNDILFLYQGVLNHGRGLDLMIETMVTRPANNKLIIAGHGNSYEALQQLVGKHNASSRIKFIGRIPLQDLPSYTKGADIGFNLLENLNLSKKMASPNKLFEYIHAGIPVICSNSLENKKVLTKYSVGVLVENNIAAISKGMDDALEQLQSKNLAQELKTCAQNYSWEKQEETLLKIVSL